MRDLRALPKVDLHVHLEGSIRHRTVQEIAARHGAPVPAPLDRAGFRDFAHFIDHYNAVTGCLREAEDFRRIAYELCEDEAAEGVRYAEVTLSLTEHGVVLGDWDAPLAGALEGFAEGERAFGVRCRVVIDLVRGHPLAAAERSLEAALRSRDRGVIALGLGGSERHPPEPFADIFRTARAAGLHSVPHAGETLGAASIRGALDALGAERVGHGVRALDDDDLVAELRERAIPLEVCVTSNVALGVARSLAEHPFLRLCAAGLVVTLNSDDPALFASPLAGEYAIARRVFGLDDHALYDNARACVRASFAAVELAGDLLSDIDELLGDEDISFWILL